MPTFLTTPKMAPALAARIEDSVRGRRQGGVAKPARARVAVHLVTLVRFGVPLCIAAMVATLVHFVRQERAELERARSSLLSAVQTESASLTASDLGKVAMVESWAFGLSGAYDGDVVADSLRAPGVLDATLARPSLYVRGPLVSFQTPAALAEAAAASSKDAFVRCLVDPPAGRGEKLVLASVLTTHPGAEGLAGRVHRLEDAEAILPLLQRGWADGVRFAPDVEAVGRLRRQLDKTPFERGVPALKATLLIMVMDEPTHGGPTELDGEGAHDVRVGVVDLAAGSVLLRLRKHVDPSWVSPAKRPMYAGALDGCVLAMDVRDGVVAK